MCIRDRMNGEFHFSHDKGDKAFCRVRFTFIINEENREEERPLVSVIGRKILLVEDNELNMEIAEFILRKEGMDVIRAWNGKEALERFEASAQGEISVILMDLVMPVMDGFEASRSIRALAVSYTHLDVYKRQAQKRLYTRVYQTFCRVSWRFQGKQLC